ncbi:unnamed protein product [Merluccius merluccius]
MEVSRSPVTRSQSRERRENGRTLWQTVNEIAEALDSGESRTMLYLCGRLDLDSTAEGLQEFLRSRVSLGQMNHLHLVELLFELKRFDLLHKVFSIRAHQIESALGNGHVLSKYRATTHRVYVGTSLGPGPGPGPGPSPGPGSGPRGAGDLTTVNEIAEALDSGESRTMLYLCGRLDLDSTAEGLQEFLRSRVSLGQMNHLHLVELLFELKRFDLLHKVFSIRAHQIESALGNGHVLSKYSVPLKRMLIIINNNPCTDRPYRSSCIEEYSLRAEPRGLCLIIDCVGTDGERMERAFRDLHFRVHLHKLLSVADTMSVLRKTSRRVEEHRGADAFVCCIISRGTAASLLATDAQHGVSAGVPLDTVRQFFDGNVCPALAGTPKLFFIQRYGVVQEPPPRARPGDSPGALETDGGGVQRGAGYPHGRRRVLEPLLDERASAGAGEPSLRLPAGADRRPAQRRTHLVDVHTQLNGLIYDHNRRNPAARYDIDLKHTLRKQLHLT